MFNKLSQAPVIPRDFTKNVSGLSSSLDPDFSAVWHKLQFSWGTPTAMEVFAGFKVDHYKHCWKLVGIPVLFISRIYKLHYVKKLGMHASYIPIREETTIGVWELPLLWIYLPNALWFTAFFFPLFSVHFVNLCAWWGYHLPWQHLCWWTMRSKTHQVSFSATQNTLVWAPSLLPNGFNNAF